MVTDVYKCKDTLSFSSRYEIVLSLSLPVFAFARRERKRKSECAFLGRKPRPQPKKGKYAGAGKALRSLIYENWQVRLLGPDTLYTLQHSCLLVLKIANVLWFQGVYLRDSVLGPTFVRWQCAVMRIRRARAIGMCEKFRPSAVSLVSMRFKWASDRCTRFVFHFLWSAYEPCNVTCKTVIKRDLILFDVMCSTSIYSFLFVHIFCCRVIWTWDWSPSRHNSSFVFV